MNKIEKYVRKTYIDKDYKDICIPKYLYKEKLEQLDKYKKVIDKIKEIMNEDTYVEKIYKHLEELLEEVE